MADSEIKVEGKVAYVPTSALLAFTFTVLCWCMEAVMGLIRWGSEGRYPDDTRMVVTMSLTLVFTAWMILQGKERRRVALQAMSGRTELGVRPSQAILLAAVAVVFGGVLLVWLINGPESTR